MNIDPAKLLELIDVLLRALGTRMLCIMALLMTFSLYASAMYRASWLTFAIASAFALSVLWPVLLATFYSRRNDDGGSNPP